MPQTFLGFAQRSLHEFLVIGHRGSVYVRNGKDGTTENTEGTETSRGTKLMHTVTGFAIDECRRCTKICSYSVPSVFSVVQNNPSVYSLSDLTRTQNFPAP
jgi:hypothetical protein